ncbi:MAG: energy transducer TonB, partial [Desulfobulbus sp.]|nr:energy transducer TonB [Desulfobulbus sp.]
MDTALNRYPGLNQHSGLDWLKAALVAAVLNLGLYLLMPALIATAPNKPAFETLVPQISLTRLRPPETRKNNEPVKPPEPKPLQRPKPTTTPLPTPKLELPFELNPRLPSSPNTLNLPPMETALPQGNFSETFSVGQLDGPLTTLVQLPPNYPHSAKRRNIEGWVKVCFVVDENGIVGKVSVLAAKPAGVFEQSVLRCLSSWRFKPGTV